MPYNFSFILSLVSLFCVLSVTTSAENETDASTSVTPVLLTSTTQARENKTSCGRQTTCEACLKVKGCYFCQDGNKCRDYTVKNLIPSDECGVKSINIGTCQVNFLVVIVLSSIGAVLVFIALVACCCCCCRKGSPLKLSKDDLKWVRQREERRARAEEKRKERAAKTLEIRNKYGLFKEDTPYHRFDT